MRQTALALAAAERQSDERHRKSTPSLQTEGSVPIRVGPPDGNALAIRDRASGMEHLWSQADGTADNRSQMEREPQKRSNRPIGNRWQPSATVPQRMVKEEVECDCGAAE